MLEALRTENEGWFHTLDERVHRAAALNAQTLYASCDALIKSTLPERMKNAAHHSDGGAFGTPGRSRTCGLQSRSLTLYPTELRAHAKDIIVCQFTFVKGGGGM